MIRSFCKCKLRFKLEAYKFREGNRNYSSDSKKTIRIGCASGFWGDTATSVPQLVYGGKLQYLVFDYLAEITMSLLTAAKRKFPDFGYAPDFVHFAMKPFLSEIKKRNIRVISNAGGINPLGCAKALDEVAKELDIKLKIAVVMGDDLINFKDEFRKRSLSDMYYGGLFPEKITSMNAYLGCGGIVKALENDVDVVITGRCVDSAVTLAPLVHEFGWNMQDWDKLASGSLAGHIIECGAQSTGGICTNWEEIKGWDNMGFPIVECSENGIFSLSKPKNTGGKISFDTVAEQLVYEIDNPRSYLLPDVTCDFSSVTIKEIGENVVSVSGAKGTPPSDSYKVCATYMDGYRITGVSPIIGPNAAEKGRRSSEAVLKRTRRILDFLGMEDFRRTNLEILGTGHNYGPNATTQEKSNREAVMWVAAHHDEKRALEVLAREIAASGTGAAPGLTTMVGGRPKISPVLRLYSFLLPKKEVKVEIHCHGKVQKLDELNHEYNNSKVETNADEGGEIENLVTGTNTYCLFDLAYTRSGDKGNNSNIGVISRDPKYYQYLMKHLTVEVVAEYFSYLFEKPELALTNIERYTLPGINGFNFVLKDALGGGGVNSLRSDPQGKALGQIMLDLKLKNLPDLKLL